MLLNKKTTSWLEAFLQQPSATLLLDTAGDGQTGRDITRHIHQQLVTTKGNPLVMLSFDGQKTIGIDDVRGMQKQLTLKANNTNGAVSRIIAIENAERLTPEAQNALLKLLEELPAKTLIILLVRAAELLLSTIRSRCFTLSVLPLEEAVALDYATKQGTTRDEAKRAFTMSDGNATLFKALLSGDDDTYAQSIDDAKRFLQATVFERQKQLKTLTDKTYDVTAFLSAARVVAKSAMRHATNTQAKKRWRDILTSVIETEQLLTRNVSPKLALLNLSVSV